MSNRSIISMRSCVNQRFLCPLTSSSAFEEFSFTGRQGLFPAPKPVRGHPCCMVSNHCSGNSRTRTKLHCLTDVSCAFTVIVLITESPPFTLISVRQFPNAFNRSPSMPSPSNVSSSLFSRLISSGPITALAPSSVSAKIVLIESTMSAVDTDPKIGIVDDLGDFGKGSEAKSSSAAADDAPRRRLGGSCGGGSGSGIGVL